MTDAQWKRALELFEAVSNLPQSAAQAQLAEMSEEPAVVREVTEILRTAAESEQPAEAEEPRRYSGAVIGRYEVLDLLGRGSSGEVYLGRDRELGRRVALKIMSMEGASVSSAGRRFLREAQAVSPLNHPNIVTLHEVMASNSPPVIVMELVEGKSLRLLCGQPMPLAQARQIGLQMMQALAFAHANGVVHRDLKPENVMVRHDGYVKVLDFGLARRSFLDKASVEFSSAAGLPVGTLRYMSPEQCRGESATTASDVFAAGIVLYEMFAGRHPFQSDSPLDTAHAIAWEQPQPPSHWNKDIPASIESLILRMLAKDPAWRPSSTEAEEALAPARTSDTPTSKTRRLYGRMALVGILAMGSVFGLWFTRDTRRLLPTVDEPGANLEIVPVAGLPGKEGMPSISADGTKVAFEFTSASSPASHIYVKDLAASSLVALTNDKLSDLQPVFSRDGTKIAFLRREKERLHVMVIPATGGIETQVGEVSESSPVLRSIAWDSEGTTLIVSDGLSKPEVQVALFAIPVTGGTRRQITFPKSSEIDCMPLVSPDGHTLGFARLRSDTIGRIWAIPLADGLASRGEKELRPLTAAPQPIGSWGWSSDSRSLLISSVKGTRRSLWRQRLDDAPPERVSGLDDQVAQLSISRLGNRLVYAPTAPGNISIWLYASSPSQDAPRQVIASDLADVDARYSPDGRNIAFASLRDGGMGLWVCSRDGSNARKMAFLEDGHGWAAGSPNWSPDGRWIAFDGGSDPRKIYLLDVLGGKPRRLTGPGSSSDGLPAWSPDGRWVYYSSDRGGLRNIWKVPAAGGASVQVTHHTGFECMSSPDGQSLYYTRYDGTHGIWRLSLASGDDQPVPGLESVSTRCWEGSSRGIYFVVGNPAVLKFFDFTTQKTQPIRTMPLPPIDTYRGLSMAPDGRSLLYAQREEPRSNVMLVKNFR